MRRYDKPLNCCPHNFVQPSGETVRDKYVLDVSPNGEEKLILSGTVDIQEEINSHRDACDLAKILEKHEMLGTLSTLAHSGNGVVDLTKIPCNLHDMKKLLDKSEELFNNLKPEVKAKYENFETFLSVFGSASAMQSFVLQNEQKNVHHELQKDDGGKEA